MNGTQIKCGNCNCEYEPTYHDGCPQCGFGKLKTYTTTQATIAKHPSYGGETPCKE